MTWIFGFLVLFAEFFKKKASLQGESPEAKNI
jgi:hypothetical protein